MTTKEDQLSALHSQLLFQEHELDKLHQALYEQQKRMDRLELQLKQLSEQARELVESQADMPANQKPPHY